jgi:hypothetical protein
MARNASACNIASAKSTRSASAAGVAERLPASAPDVGPLRRPGVSGLMSESKLRIPANWRGCAACVIDRLRKTRTHWKT